MDGPVSRTRDEYLQELHETFEFEEPEHLGATVTMAERSDILTVNGLLVNDWPSRYITQLIFEKLVTSSPVDGLPAPQLADFWEVSEDRRTYIFHLNQNAKWHDGRDFTAHDVEFSYDTVLNGFPESRQFWNIRSQIASARALDDDTFELVVVDPTVTALWDIPAKISIIPTHIWADVEKEHWASDPGSTGADPSRVIGTGPFIFRERIKNQKVTLTRNDKHYSTVPAIDAFVMRVMDSSDIPGALMAGDVDIAEGIDKNNILADVDSGRLAYGRPPLNRMVHLAFNTKRAPLDEVLVRRALFIALDREAIRREIAGSYGEVAFGTHPPPSLAYAPAQIEERFAFDEERARDLLAQAGWADSDGNGIVERDGQELHIQILTNAEMPQADAFLRTLRDSWQRIGVDANYSRPDHWNSVMGRIGRGGSDLDFDVMIRNARWDQSGNQGDLFGGDPPGGSNLMGWSNAEYDRLNDLQLHECDPAKRRAILIEMSNLVWSEVPVGIVRFIGASVAYRPSLHNYEFHDITYWSIPFVWKDA
jgi:peptide/nickel transport system substrate-binding protein